MATVKYFIKGKTNPATIYLRFKSGRLIDSTKSTGYLINPKDWNNDKKKPKQNSPHNKNLNIELNDLSNFILRKSNELPKTDLNNEWLEYQIKIFRKEITPEQKRSDKLIDCIQFVIDNASVKIQSNGKMGLSKSRVNSYKNLIKIVTKYQKYKKPIRIKDINVSFGQTFLRWMLHDQNYSESYARKKIDDLKTVCRNAELDGIEVNTQLRNVRGGKPNKDSFIYLNPQELEKIKNAHIVSSALQNARKWLLFGCTIGQRGSDLLKINEDNFITRDGLEVIELTQKKTGKEVTIPILEETRAIINDGMPKQISIQNFNKYIKEVCKIAEIDQPVKASKYTMIDEDGKEIPKDENGNYLKKGVKRKIEGVYPKYELVGSHICRRSYASNQYGKIPTPLIMRITSHSTEREFLGYIQKNSLDYAQMINDFYQKEKIKQKNKPHLNIVEDKSTG